MDNSSPDDDFDGVAEVQLYDIDGSTLIYSSGQPRIDILSYTVGELIVNRMTVTAWGMFPIGAGKIIKCYTSIGEGNYYLHFCAFRIAPPRD